MIKPLFSGNTNNNQTRNIMMMGNRIVMDNQEMTKEELEAHLAQEDRQNEEVVSDYRHSS